MMFSFRENKFFIVKNSKYDFIFCPFHYGYKNNGLSQQGFDIKLNRYVTVFPILWRVKLYKIIAEVDGFYRVVQPIWVGMPSYT